MNRRRPSFHLTLIAVTKPLRQVEELCHRHGRQPSLIQIPQHREPRKLQRLVNGLRYVEALRQAWMPLPPDVRYPTGAEKASEMSSYISTAWPRLGRPCSERVIEIAWRFAEARRDAFDPEDSVLAHGDPHAWNTLLAHPA